MHPGRRIGGTGNPVAVEVPQLLSTGERLIGPILASASEVADLLQTRFRYRTCSGTSVMDDVPSAPARRGRPSTVARYVPSIVEWLRDQPELSSADTLRRIRVAGYRGGKSALYDLVRRLRATGRRMSRSGREHPRASGE